jgi:hypothetical protein
MKDMRYFTLITRVALPAIALASLVGGLKWGYGFSGGRG